MQIAKEIQDIPMKKPILVHYYVTNICNARCEFCSIWENKDPNFATPDQVRKNLTDAKKAGAKFVDFTGGEPTLNKDLPELLTIAKELGFITSVTTNTLLFPRMVEKLAGKIDLLHFSLDGDTAQLHDKIRGIESYDKTVAAIPLALKHNLVPDLLFTYTDENIDHFMGVWELARKHKLVVILDPVFSMNEHEIVTEATHAKARKLAKLPGVYLNSAHHEFRTKGSNNIDKPRCHSVESTIVILNNDTLAAPCYHHKETTIQINGKLNEILKSDQYKELRAMQGRYNFCKGCHINCYMDPSYNYEFDLLMAKTLLSKWKYSFTKYILYRRKWPIVWGKR